MSPVLSGSQTDACCRGMILFRTSIHLEVIFKIPEWNTVYLNSNIHHYLHKEDHMMGFGLHVRPLAGAQPTLEVM